MGNMTNFAAKHPETSENNRTVPKIAIIVVSVQLRTPERKSLKFK